MASKDKDERRKEEESATSDRSMYGQACECLNGRANMIIKSLPLFTLRTVCSSSNDWRHDSISTVLAESVVAQSNGWMAAWMHAWTLGSAESSITW